MKQLISIAVAMAFLSQSAAGAQSVAIDKATAAVCPVTDESVVVRPLDGQKAPKDARGIPAAFQWTQAPSAGVLRVAAWLEIGGPGSGRVLGYLPNRLWLSNRCAYQLRSANGYRPSEGEHWFAYDPFPPPRSVTILSSGETTDHKVVTIALSNARGGSRLMLCRAGQNEHPSCRPFISSPREIRAIRYLPSPDTLMGSFGIIQSAPGSKMWAIGVSVNASSFRSPR